jgi:hypothetical protein
LIHEVSFACAGCSAPLGIAWSGLASALNRGKKVAMAKKTYRGSCHCKRIRFEADLDLAQGTAKCNCSYCWKVRAWTIGIKPDAFRLLSRKEDCREYGFREGSTNHHVFCSNCGVRVYTYGYVEEIGGDYVSVALSTLDDLTPAELVAAPVVHMNGRDDDWFHVPAETRHL